MKSISWIEEGIKRTEKILNSLSNKENWDCETFGTEIRKEGVLIYFLTDDSYFDIIPLDCFYKALVNWRKFLDTEPNIKNTMKIECKKG